MCTRNDKLAALLKDKGKSLHTTAWMILRHREDAEDAVMEALTRVAMRPDNQCHIQTYVQRAVHNVALGMLKQSKEPADVDGWEEWFPSGDPPLGHDMEESQTVDAVRKAIRELPEHHRTVILAYYWGGLDSEQIAKALGLPTGTVKSQLSRARTSLKRALAGVVEGRI